MKLPVKHITILPALIFFCYNFCVAQKDSTKTRHSILKVARQVSRGKTVDRGPVGFSATLTKQFDRFIFLWNNATDNELVALTNYKSAVVRAYAFEILVLKGYSGVKTILNQHIADNAVIHIRSGCINSTAPVNFYFLQLLTPGMNDKNLSVKLTTVEVEAIKRKMMEAKAMK
ncbi:hypothetical protein [Ferruginibacter sp.]